MVSFDLNFRSMLCLEEIVEYEGPLCTEGSISWLSTNIGSCQRNMVQVVCGYFSSFVGVSVLLGSAYCQSVFWSVSSIWFLFRVFWANKTQNPKNRIACRPRVEWTAFPMWGILSTFNFLDPTTKKSSRTKIMFNWNNQLQQKFGWGKNSAYCIF